jgi:hypothetical protein
MRHMPSGVPVSQDISGWADKPFPKNLYLSVSNKKKAVGGNMT